MHEPHPTSKASQLCLKLHVAKKQLAYYERELRKAEATTNSFIHEWDLLQAVPAELRPPEYASTMEHIQKQLDTFRARYERYKTCFEVERSKLYELLVQVDELCQSDEVHELCLGIIRQPEAMPLKPGGDVLSCHDLMAWLEEANMEIVQAAEKWNLYMGELIGILDKDLI